ncbi:MAG: 50S ribosomal protein L24 [Planctomycetes bacterium]|nr:50S ribosomal protein L24 [Planctomycetota bacterium]
MKIQRGDSVVVTAGDQKGPAPHKVINVLDGGKRLVVEGINRVYKHVRRGHPRSPQGGRLQLEAPIDSSNVKLYCGSCNQAVRVGYRYTDDGAKERWCKTCSSSLGTVSPPKQRYAHKK